MIYAPVCIATLNRYEHLRKCLESLSRCTWADQTEVYVALDYPPSNQWDKYAPGWEKNREFLRSCGDMGFKKLHVIEREENYGIWLPGHKNNFKCLISDIVQRYDRYIVSEDDNVFAPCFLEYMDKALELFYDDDNVFFIGGYKYYYPLRFMENTFLRQSIDYSAWGVGKWTKKTIQDVDYKFFRNYLKWHDIRKFLHIYGWGVVSNLISKSCKSMDGYDLIDADMWTYMQVTGKEQIIPNKTLVQNIGLDGSGVTMHDAIGSHEQWADPQLNPLSADEHFDFVGTGYEYFEENRKIYYHGKYWMTEWQYFKKACRKLVKLVISI